MLLLFGRSGAEAASVQFGGLDLLRGRLEVAGVEPLLPSAAEDRGHRTEDTGHRTRSAETCAGGHAEVGHRVRARFLLVSRQKNKLFQAKRQRRDAGGRRCSAVCTRLHRHFCRFKIHFLSFFNAIGRDLFLDYLL